MNYLDYLAILISCFEKWVVELFSLYCNDVVNFTDLVKYRASVLDM